RQRAQLEHLALELADASLGHCGAADLEGSTDGQHCEDSHRCNPAGQERGEVHLVADPRERLEQIESRYREHAFDPSRVRLERVARPCDADEQQGQADTEVDLAEQRHRCRVAAYQKRCMLVRMIPARVLLVAFGGFLGGLVAGIGCATSDQVLEKKNRERGIADVALCHPKVTEDCYTGPKGTVGRGACKLGVRTCDSDGSWTDC